MRPGEKVHEDMLSEYELSNSWIHPGMSNHVMVLPHYVPYNHISGVTKYEGKPINSSLFLNSDLNTLVELLKRGLDD